MNINDREKVKKLNPIDDDFLKKMAEDIEFCQEVITIATGNKHLKVVSCTSQKWVKNLQGRSVILDIVCENENGQLIMVEVQKADDDDHARRVRYNVSCLTANVTKPGEKFREIKDIISIYISKNDFIGEGLPPIKRKAVYHVERIVKETGTELNNGITEIYVNAKIKDNSDAARLMTVFTDSNAYDYEVCPKTSERKNYLKNTERGITEMCAIMDEIRNEGRIEGRNEGRIEGRIEGKMQGAIKMARTMLEKKLPEDVILSTLQESLGLSDTEAKALFEKEVACLV